MLRFRYQVIPIATALVALTACTTPLGLSDYQIAGRFSIPAGPYLANPNYSPPPYFVLSPLEVFSSYGHLCHAKYSCTYFANDKAYYLLPDYGVVPSLSVPTHANAIIDGRTGKLLKTP